jgi:hypothetical protein
VRVVAVVLLFGAKNFLYLAVTQYYFMLQMPFLLGALYFLLKYFDLKVTNKKIIYLIVASALLSIATAIEVNNIFVIVLTGIIISVRYKEIPANIRHALIFYLSSAAVGFPLFFLGYFLSSSDVSFFAWALTYAGVDNEGFKQLYGLQTSLDGIVFSLAKLGYNFAFGNFVETSGLGLVLKSLISSEALEFKPDYIGVVLALVAMPVIAIVQLLVFINLYRNHNASKLSLFLFGWIAAYLVFAFLWDNGGSIFWFQTLPVIVYIYAIYTHRIFINNENKLTLIKVGLSVIPVIIFTLNTIQIAVPTAFFDIDRGIALHKEIIKTGDLEITTGWDKYRWMDEDAVGVDFTKLQLMNMAIKDKNDPQHISNLPQLVSNQLASGNRVIVARLYNRDSDPNPWYNLIRMGWKREKIKRMLDSYCNRELSRIDDVVFHELYQCKKL